MAYNFTNLDALMKDAEAGNAQAQYCLAVFYTHGNSVEKDDKKAVYWLEKSAAQGFPVAYYLLASNYDLGYGVAKNKKKAAELYKLAAPGLPQEAEAGDTDAAVALGVMYDCGDGVEKNQPVAAYWYQKAVELGAVGAQDSLDKLLREGIRPAQSGGSPDDIRHPPTAADKKQNMIALIGAGVLGVVGLIAGGFLGLIIGAAVGFIALKYGVSVVKAFIKGYNS